jgi:hypothetical protein
VFVTAVFTNAELLVSLFGKNEPPTELPPNSKV